MVTGDFVSQLDQMVCHARSNDKWRVEYMTLEMHDQMVREEGIAEGKKTIILSMLRNGMSPEEISRVCDVPIDEINAIKEETE